MGRSEIFTFKMRKVKLPTMSGKAVGLLILIGSSLMILTFPEKLVEKLSTRDSKAMAGTMQS